MTEPDNRTAGEVLDEDTSLFDMMDLFLEIKTGEFDATEERTIEGTFPGNKTRAMGHALYVAEFVEEESDASAEREYIGEVDGRESHRIDIHINK